MVADYGDKDLDWGLIILISYTGQASVHYLIFSTIKLELDQAGSITLIRFCVGHAPCKETIAVWF